MTTATVPQPANRHEVDGSMGHRDHRSDQVVRLALENAVSVASVLLLSEAALTELPEPKAERTSAEEFQ